ncbi:MAG: HlyD family efflux transporter periplasmic adaptor subunit [Ruminococcaceae bacterium]|nr:HlyD family efflux transporter periplasmic adaptor subunit [Oscillospiraceae bacterium]
MQLNSVKEKMLLGGEKLKNLPKAIKAMSKKKKILFSVVAVVLIAFLVLRIVLPSGEQAKTMSTAFADRGNISVVISGTGTIEPIDEYEVTSLVKGEILSDTFEEGDLVEKGDLLYQIDSSDLENTLEKAQLNLQKSRLSYDQTMDELAKLNVTTDYSGTITETYVKPGDSVNNGTKIADLADMNTMVLAIPFNESDAANIRAGSTAEVMLTNSFYTLTGTVRRVSSGNLISAEGVAVRTVEIEVTNPGAIKQGDSATAIIGGAACNGPGTFDYNVETSITAEASGKVVAMNYGKGDVVSAGAVIVALESTNADRTRLNSQISLRDSQLSIDNYHKQLEDYQITAPISGTVLKKTSKAGDTLDNTNASVVMAVIADMSTIVFEMNVDELDISKIEVGQRVSVTADALEDRVYGGYVDYVSVVGTTQNGVTTYPITVVVENPEDLIPGMNVSAEIVVESREDVLRVPVTAVNRGNIVYVKDDGKKTDAPAPSGRPEGISKGIAKGAAPTDRQEQGGRSIPGGIMGNAPDGFRAVRVETGLNDSDYIEILSGLSEGDEVYVTISTSSGDSLMEAMMGMSGGMPGGGMSGGGMPGGMSGGGMPGGGMSGGR